MKVNWYDLLDSALAAGLLILLVAAAVAVIIGFIWCLVELPTWAAVTVGILGVWAFFTYIMYKDC